jgi:hypothetical protein
VISDFRHMSEYRDAFSRLGLELRNVPLSLATFPPLRIVTAQAGTLFMSALTVEISVALTPGGASPFPYKWRTTMRATEAT